MTSKTIQMLIDRELHALASRAGTPLYPAIAHASMGGKRTRGLLLVLAGDAAGQRGAPGAATLVRAAACLEMLHAATLVQDDIFDRSRMRRGRHATHVRFGLPVAMLASDWMLLEAIRGAYRLHPAYGEALSRCAQGMVSGAACELAPVGGQNLPAWREHALAVARAKTGEMFGLALCGAASLRGDPCRAAVLHGLGVELGLAFQYLDDVVDLHGDSVASGKEVGCDLRSGLLTLPMLDALPLLAPALAHHSPELQGALPASLAAGLQAHEVRQALQRRAHRQWENALASLRDSFAPAEGGKGDKGARLVDALRCLAQTMLPAAAERAAVDAAA